MIPSISKSCRHFSHTLWLFLLCGYSSTYSPYTSKQTTKHSRAHSAAFSIETPTNITSALLRTNMVNSFLCGAVRPHKSKSITMLRCISSLLPIRTTPRRAVCQSVLLEGRNYVCLPERSSTNWLTERFAVTLSRTGLLTHRLWMSLKASGMVLAADMNLHKCILVWSCSGKGHNKTRRLETYSY